MTVNDFLQLIEEQRKLSPLIGSYMMRGRYTIVYDPLPDDIGYFAEINHDLRVITIAPILS